MIDAGKRDARVTAVLARAPEWLRRDFASAEPALRARAEETLATMIKAAVTAA